MNAQPVRSAPMVGPTFGLRQRKKQQTRAALWLTAMRLYVAQGITRTTIAQIAESAGVSQRTFFRYYGSKEYLTIGLFENFYDTFESMVESRAGKEPFLTSVKNSFPIAMSTTLGSADLDGEIRDGLRLFHQLLPVEAELNSTAEAIRNRAKRRLAGLIAGMSGVNPSVDPRPAVMASLAMTLVLESTHWWIRHPASSLTEIADSMFTIAGQVEEMRIG